MIRVRVDDFPQTRGEPQHTLDAFRDFDRCLREGIGNRRYLLGVIPGRCTVEDLLMVRNETDCVVGMHGTDHDEARLDRNGGNQFEPFLTARDVIEELTENRAALEMAVGRPVLVYMPPRNQLRLGEAACLSASGFGWYTTGPETNPVLRFTTPAAGIVPIHSEPPHEYGRTDEMFLRGSHEYLKAVDHDVVLTLHWTWEANVGLHHLTKFLAEIPDGLFTDFDA